MTSTPLPENAPQALYADADGNIWRDGPAPNSFSMARTNPDNSPIPYPLTTYVPAGIQPTEVHERFTDQSRPVSRVFTEAEPTSGDDRWAEGFAKGYHAAAAIFHGPDPRLVTLTPEEAAAIVEPSDPDQCMSAYYYGFERTGFALIDDVLSAVATAGKHYHGTDQWASPDSCNDESTEEELIQAASNRAADRLRALAARLAEVSS